MTERVAEYARRTHETEIAVRLDLDGRGETRIETGIGFLDHLLEALGRHAGFDLALTARGDLAVDDHHTAEDCALGLGSALDTALGERAGIGRFGWAYAPLDEALARAVVDLSGRPWARIALGLHRERLGTLATENIGHFLRSLAVTARAAIHVEVLYGGNDHHRAEAAFKALALALHQATARSGDERVPSTKGTLT